MHLCPNSEGFCPSLRYLVWLQFELCKQQLYPVSGGRRENPDTFLEKVSRNLESYLLINFQFR